MCFLVPKYSIYFLAFLFGIQLRFLKKYLIPSDLILKFFFKLEPDYNLV